MNQYKHKRFALIALLMLLLFTYPILASVNKQPAKGSFPSLYLHLGIVWLLSIVALYFTANTTRRK